LIPRACQDFREQVALLFEGAPGSLDAAGRAHWLDCPDCRALFESETALERLLRADRVDAPAGLAAAVLAGLEPARAEAARAAALDALLESVVVTVPEGTAERVLAGLSAARRRERGARLARRALVGVAAAAALVLALWRWGARPEPAPSAVDLVDAPPLGPGPDDAALDEDEELVAYAVERWELLMDDDVDLWLASLDPLDQARIEFLGDVTLDESAAQAPPVQRR